MEYSFLHGFVISISLGALVGMVRQWSDQHAGSEDEAVAGLRTFSLWSLLGFVSAHLGASYNPALFPVSLGVFAVLLLASSFPAKAGKDREVKLLGQTSIAAAFLTFFAGALIYGRELIPAVVIGAGTMIILASKPVVHSWTERMTKQDIYLTLQFIAVTGLILPLVPNQGYGPLNAINPFQIWLMVVLISGLGFVGYVAMRLAGAKAGIMLTGVAGGLASSTATTLAFTRTSKHSPQLAPVLATGIVIASAIMAGRLLVLLFAVNPAFSRHLVLPLAFMAAPAALYTAWSYWKGADRRSGVEAPTVPNPLDLKTAIKFALLYGVIVLLVRLSNEYGGAESFYPLTFISGLTNTDAIALSLSSEVQGPGLTVSHAAQGVLLAAVANTLFKIGFAVIFGARQLRRPLLIALLPMAACGAIAVFFV